MIVSVTSPVTKKKTKQTKKLMVTTCGDLLPYILNQNINIKVLMKWSLSCAFSTLVNWKSVNIYYEEENLTCIALFDMFVNDS